MKIGNLRWLFAVLLLALGTGCPEDESASLVIVSPESGATLGFTDDIDPDTDGVQFEAVFQANNIAAGTAVTLYLDSIGSDPLVSGTVGADGMVTFPIDAGDGGSFRLTACTEACRVQSATATVTVTGPGCVSLAFTQPAVPMSGPVLLGEADSTGSGCEDFRYDFAVATNAEDGTMAQIYVNDVPQTTAVASGNVFRFTGVQLSNSRDVATTIAVQQLDAPGCDPVSFPATITVDCDGVRCEFTDPSFAGGFLNSSDDTSMEDGFQAEFSVQTDVDVANVTLSVDGDDVDAGPDGSGVAIFSSIDLSEGRHTVTARCVDAAGNVGSGSATFEVDTVACGVAFTTPDADTLFIDSDDANDAVDGTQIPVTGTATGDDCVSAAVALDCASAGDAADLSAGAVTGEVTLSGSTEDQPLCIRVTDTAGNIGEAERNVRFRSAAPVVAFTSPAPASTTAYNILGDAGTGVVADLDAGTTACEADITVSCSEEGVDVVLTRMDTMANLALVPCTGGVATFSSVALPSVGTAAEAYDLRAQQTADRLTGSSGTITVYPDCMAPSLLITQPNMATCGGGFLRPATDDVVPGGEFDYDFRVLNSSTPQDPVTLTATPAVGAPVVVTQDVPSGVNFIIRATLPGGDYSTVACSTDEAGNQACTPACTFAVADVPTLELTSPTDGAILSLADDCDGAGPGFIQVTGTTDAGASATATIAVGGGVPAATTITGGAISACVPSSGEGSQAVTVEVVDPMRGTVSRTVTVSVDTVAPTTGVDLVLDSTPDRRGGTVRLGWMDGADADGMTGLDAYEIRCSDAEITDDATWASAMVVATGSPSAPGSARTTDVSGFVLGTTRYCAIRQTDVGGQPTPVGADVEITLDFLQTTLTGGSATNFGREFAGVGDVDGDGQDDIAVATATSIVVYAGGSVPLTEIATITGFGAFGFPVQVAAIGDLDGDTVDDFVVGDMNANGFAGAAYVFCGNGPWTAGGATTAVADAIFNSAVANGAFGASVAGVGDVDGDGAPDIGVGGVNLASPQGESRVYFSDPTWCRDTSGPSTPLAVDPAAADSFTFTAAGLFQQGQRIVGLGNIDGANGDDFASVAIGGSGMFSAISVIQVPAYTAGSGPVDVTVAGTVTTLSQPGNTWQTIAAVGDVDGDGRRDLAGGSINDNLVRIYFGTASGYVDDPANYADIVADGTALANDAFGRSLGTGYHPFFGVRGNLFGGTRTSLIVGSRQNGTGPGADRPADGRVFFDVTTADSVRSSADLVVPSAANDSRVSVNFVGDIDGDTVNDFAVADYQVDPPTLTIFY